MSYRTTILADSPKSYWPIDEGTSPSYPISVALTQGDRYVWDRNYYSIVNTPRGVEGKHGDYWEASTFYHGTLLKLTVTFNQAWPGGNMALYMIDWDGPGCSQTVTVNGGSPIAVSSFVNGAWVIYPVAAQAAGTTLEIEVTLNGGVNAVLAGIFFDAGVPILAPSGPTQAPQGHWRGNYGSWASHFVWDRSVDEASSPITPGVYPNWIDGGGPVSVAGPCDGEAGLSVVGSQGVWSSPVAPYACTASTFSVEGWVQTNAAVDTFYRALWADSGTNNFFLAATMGGGPPAGGNLGLYEWAGGVGIIDSGISIRDNRWHHVVATFQYGVANGTKLYLDGGLILTTTYSGGGAPSGLTFGGSTVNLPIQGNVAQGAIYDYVLSPAQVLAHFQAANPAPSIHLPTFVQLVQYGSSAAVKGYGSSTSVKSLAASAALKPYAGSASIIDKKPGAVIKPSSESAGISPYSSQATIRSS